MVAHTRNVIDQVDCLCYCGYDRTVPLLSGAWKFSRSIYDEKAAVMPESKRSRAKKGWSELATDDGMRRFVQMMSDNESVTRLIVHLSDKVSIKARDMFLDFLEASKGKYQCVGLSGCRFKPAQLARFARIVEECQWETIELGDNIAVSDDETTFALLMRACAKASRLATFAFAFDVHHVTPDHTAVVDALSELLMSTSITDTYLDVEPYFFQMVHRLTEEFDYHGSLRWCDALCTNTTLRSTNLTLALTSRQIESLLPHTSLTTLWTDRIMRADVLTVNETIVDLAGHISRSPDAPTHFWLERNKRLELARCETMGYVLK